MTNKELIVEAFDRNGGEMRLGYILQYSWGYEFRARVTELRKMGFTITCERAKNPSDNVYRMKYPRGWDIDGDGQLAFA